MSANLDVVRDIWQAWERGDYDFVDWEAPDIEFVFVDGPMPGTWHGTKGISEAWGAFLSAWDDFHGTAEEIRELDDERVLILCSMRGVGKTSGLDLARVKTEAATLMHVRDGEVTRIAVYFDRARALADLGL
jgi:ketosteroid isomerase-like protein